MTFQANMALGAHGNVANAGFVGSYGTEAEGWLA
jgi:hypothetical protein